MKRLREICIAFSVMSFGVAAQADSVCYDFDGIALNTEYHVGDVVNTRHSVIHFKDYKVNGTRSQASQQVAQVLNTQIANGARPELRTYLINPHVVLNAPVRAIRFRFGEAATGATPHANLEVNGDLHEIDGGLAQANNKVIGPKNSGQARISVTSTPTADGKWNQGEIVFTAIKGKIETVSVGGVQVYIDDYCFQK